MRLRFASIAAVFTLLTGTLLAASPAHADEVTFSYTVTDTDPMTHAWPMSTLCSTPSDWGNSARHAVTELATVTVSGTYQFTDLRDEGDGRIVLLSGPYDPADVSNCIREIDDNRSVYLNAGTTYTLLQTGFGGETGSFSYRVTGPGAFLKGVVASTVTVSAPTNPATVGVPGELQASVTTPTAGIDLSGTVEFFADGTSIGTTTVDTSGAATLTGVSLPVNDHQITAEYSGNTNIAPATSDPILYTVEKASTTTSLTVSPNPVTVGQETVLTATVSGYAAEGAVEFFNGATPLGESTTTNGVASLPVSALPPGDHTITAVYAGDSSNTASTSDPITVTVAKHTTTTVLTVAPDVMSVEDATTLTATVTGGTPTGDIDFLADGTSLESVPLVNGAATLRVSGLPAGDHALTAGYSGNADHAESVSDAVVLTVEPAEIDPEPKPKPVPTPKPDPEPAPEPIEDDTEDTNPEQLATSGAPWTAWTLGSGALALITAGVILLARRRATT
ncbi:Ig-like domain repeat protein [Leucobacter weissii]|uniref:Ig-like domain repeat protein n=1 Tax=Leucobacter weissii TaxID=1983706 RepID=A0A939S5Z9_9MICO|nr:Ig-like domain-containing protein [Leucobacter weissii]MBO1901854.1 Ig-like domain repeat protein [Leucobacter weissii]